MATAGDGPTPYEPTGAGGKFRKKPFRRSIPSTPYARPPTAVRNNNPSMLKKLVDPASRLISAGAHKLFDVFRKRLPSPSPQSLKPPEINEERHDVLPNQGGNGNSASASAATGISDLELLLQQKTFTRSEIERLTSALHSKTTESPFDDSLDKHGDKRDNIHAAISTPVGTSGVLKEETAPPAELAKYYMGSRPNSQAPRQDSKLLQRTPITTVVQKTANRIGNLENGFVTPRSRGRSAMYTMARGPYSRSPSTFSHQGTKSDYGHDAALTSSQGHEGKMALKRRSSVLHVDIGPIRRIRQKANLLSQRENTSHTPRQDSKLLQRTPITTLVQKTRGRSPSTFTQQALKRKSSVLEDDIGPLRRIRQKTNLLSQSKDKTEENSLRKSPVSHDMHTWVNGDMPDILKNKALIVESTELPLKVTEVPQKKHAFQMSAPDAYFEIDDDEDDNGHVSLPLEENNKPETSAAGLLDKCPKTDLGGSVTTQTSVPARVLNSVTKNDHVEISFSNKDENGNRNGNDQKSTNMFGKSESLSPAVSAAISTDGIFSFGTSNNNLSTLDTTPASNPPTFPSLAPFSAPASTAAFTTTISATSATTTTTTTMDALSTTTTPAVIFSTSVSPQVFSFGSATSTAPSTSVAETGNSSSSSPFAIIIII